MRNKIYEILKNIYAITMTVAFVGGAIPLIPFITAIIIGGKTGESISLWLYNEYYPWIIALASVSIIIGTIAMYVGKKEALSSKTFVSSEENQDENK